MSKTASMEGWATELLHEDFRLSLRETRLIHAGATTFQTIRLFENLGFGRSGKAHPGSPTKKPTR